MVVAIGMADTPKDGKKKKKDICKSAKRNYLLWVGGVLT